MMMKDEVVKSLSPAFFFRYVMAIAVTGLLSWLIVFSWHSGQGYALQHQVNQQLDSWYSTGKVPDDVHWQQQEATTI
ncbi:MAG: hypothetical protein R8K50_10215, partial [Mariprofundus sp.]